jgi:hypothetical protein
MPARSPNQQAGLYISMRRQVGLAEGTTTMLSYLIVSGLCLLLLLRIVCKVWQNTLEIHSAAANFDKARDFPARAQQATTDSGRNSAKTGWLESFPPKYCHV